MRCVAVLLTMTVVWCCSCGGAAPRPRATTSTDWEPPDSWDDTTWMSRKDDAGPEVSTSSAEPEPAPAPTPAPASPGGSATSIRKRPMLLGAKVDETRTLSSSALYGVEGPNGTVTVEDLRTAMEHKVTELLAVADGRARKVEVTYLDKGEARINNGRERRTNSPVSGKTYVVEWANGSPRVEATDGTPVSEKEASLVSLAFRNVGAPDAFTQAVPDRPLATGVPIPALAEALEEEARRGLEGRVFFGKVRVTPKGSRAEGGATVVALDVVMQIGFVEDEAKVRMSLRGELLLQSDSAWPVLLDVRGPVAIDGVAGGIPVHGRGTARLTQVYVYR